MFSTFELGPHGAAGNVGFQFPGRLDSPKPLVSGAARTGSEQPTPVGTGVKLWAPRAPWPVGNSVAKGVRLVWKIIGVEDRPRVTVGQGCSGTLLGSPVHRLERKLAWGSPGAVGSRSWSVLLNTSRPSRVAGRRPVDRHVSRSVVASLPPLCGWLRGGGRQEALFVSLLPQEGSTGLT